MLCKYILIRNRNWTFQSLSNSSYHCNQQQQTSNNQQISMNSIQSNTQISNSGGCCPRMLPKRVIFRGLIQRSQTLQCCCRVFKYTGYIVTGHRKSLKRALRNRLPQSQSTRYNQTNPLYSSYRICSTLMCKNFCRRNIQKHDYKLKQNSKSSNINQLLQQNKIFKSLQNQ